MQNFMISINYRMEPFRVFLILFCMKNRFETGDRMELVKVDDFALLVRCLPRKKKRCRPGSAFPL
jgi:hypothetical protein